MSTPTALATYQAIRAAHFTDLDAVRDFPLIFMAAAGDRESEVSPRTHAWSVALSLCPVSFPANWVHIATIAQGLTPTYDKDITLLRNAIASALIREHRGDELAARSDLNQRGYLASLMSLEEILAFGVDYEEPSPAALSSSQGLFSDLATDAALLPGVDYVHAFLNSSPTLYHPRGLHSEVLFGPTKYGTCMCGRYFHHPQRTTCDRCGVPVAGSHLRATSTSLIAIPDTLVLINPATGDQLPYVPVVSPVLRAPRCRQGRWTLSTLDRLYTRLLVTFALAEDFPAPGQSHLLSRLAAADITQLYTG
jgi:hypothetical protein